MYSRKDLSESYFCFSEIHFSIFPKKPFQKYVFCFSRTAFPKRSSRKYKKKKEVKCISKKSFQKV